MPAPDAAVRLAAFNFLTAQTHLHDEVLPRAVLEQGFQFDGQRVPLLGPQEIFKPAILDIPISISTVPPVENRPRPYDDAVDENGLLRYRYRGTDPSHRDNLGLKKAMECRVPLIYFHGIVPGRYLPTWPAFIVGNVPAALAFTVALDAHTLLTTGVQWSESAEDEGRRRYITRETTVRLHQVAFRQRVLRAYRSHCAICSLKHEELLEAAHILPDSHPKGEPIVPNGLALCKLHHAAFDANILGIRPDHFVELRLDILEEHDGPMLKHGLQEFQNTRIWTPHAPQHRPKPEFLEERYEIFKKASKQSRAYLLRSENVFFRVSLSVTAVRLGRQRSLWRLRRSNQLDSPSRGIPRFG